MDPGQWGSWLYRADDIRKQLAEASANNQNAKEVIAAAQNVSTVSPGSAAAFARPGSISWDATSQQDAAEELEVEAGAVDAVTLPPKPVWDPPLVKFEYPNRNDNACVEDWRAGFVKTRQSLRKKLQSDLWHRTQVGARRARSAF
jgi:hypothetical protein